MTREKERALLSKFTGLYKMPDPPAIFLTEITQFVDEMEANLCTIDDKARYYYANCVFHSFIDWVDLLVKPAKKPATKQEREYVALYNSVSSALQQIVRLMNAFAIKIADDGKFDVRQSSSSNPRQKLTHPKLAIAYRCLCETEVIEPEINLLDNRNLTKKANAIVKRHMVNSRKGAAKAFLRYFNDFGRDKIGARNAAKDLLEDTRHLSLLFNGKPSALALLHQYGKADKR